MIESVLRRLRALLLGEEPKPFATRLSRDEALKLARAALVDPGGVQLTMTTVIERDGALIWYVSEPVKGSALEVEIDDDSGRVLKVGRRGGR